MSFLIGLLIVIVAIAVAYYGMLYLMKKTVEVGFDHERSVEHMEEAHKAAEERR